MNGDLLAALHFSREAFIKTTGRQPLVFVCSTELADEIGTEIVLGCAIEVDENLFGLNSYFWM